MTFYDPTDPLGWKQIAAGQPAPQQPGNINPRGLPPELLYALAGQITPMELQQVQAQGGMGAMEQQQSMDPTQQYLDTFGGDYLGEAMAIGEQTGLYEQRPYYWHDDLQEMEKIFADRAIKAGKAGYDVSMDQADLAIDQGRYGLAQGAAERDTREQNAELGDPAMDRMYLDALQVEPQSVIDMLSTNSEAAFQTIADQLPMNDEGLPWNATPAGVNRMMGIVQTYLADAEQADMQGQQAMDPATLQIDRWGQLAPEERAKEIFLNQQQPGVQRTVAPGGGVHYGASAEQDIAGGYRGMEGGGGGNRYRQAGAPAGRYKQKSEYENTPAGRLERARDRSPNVRRGGPPRTVEDVRAGRKATGTNKKKKQQRRGLVEDYQNNRYGLQQIAGVGAGPKHFAAGGRMLSKAARAAINYINPWD